jgi:hypothetical protein
MGTPLTLDKRLGDFLIHEESQEYCRESITLTNDESAAGSFEIGFPLLESGGTWTPARTAEHASVDGVLLENVDNLAAAGTKVVAVLRRGPAVINQNKLPAADYADAAFVAAELVARLAALSPPIIAKSEPTKTSTQTT